MKLTKAQIEALSSPEGIFENFHVVVGYWFTIGRGREILHSRTAQSLLDKGLIEKGQVERVFDGRQIKPCPLTDAGRSALSALGGET